MWQDWDGRWPAGFIGLEESETGWRSAAEQRLTACPQLRYGKMAKTRCKRATRGDGSYRRRDVTRGIYGVGRMFLKDCLVQARAARCSEVRGESLYRNMKRFAR